MTRNFTIVALFVVVAASVAGGVRSHSSRRHAANANSDPAIEEKYQADKIEADYHEAITTVEDRYAGEVDYEKATQAAIQGMLFTLDPHSVFFPAAEFKKLKEDQSSSFYGIGVQILRHDDGVYIQSVVDGTPASRAGLHSVHGVTEWRPSLSADLTLGQCSPLCEAALRSPRKLGLFCNSAWRSLLLAAVALPF